MVQARKGLHPSLIALSRDRRLAVHAAFRFPLLHGLVEGPSGTPWRDHPILEHGHVREDRPAEHRALGRSIGPAYGGGGALQKRKNDGEPRIQ